MWKFTKKAIKLENFPEPAATSGITIYQIVSIIQTHSLCKFGGDKILQTLIVVNFVWKYRKKSTKSRGAS